MAFNTQFDPTQIGSGPHNYLCLKKAIKIAKKVIFQQIIGSILNSILDRALTNFTLSVVRTFEGATSVTFQWHP